MGYKVTIREIAAARRIAKEVWSIYGPHPSLNVVQEVAVSTLKDEAADWSIEDGLFLKVALPEVKKACEKIMEEDVDEVTALDQALADMDALDDFLDDLDEDVDLAMLADIPEE